MDIDLERLAEQYPDATKELIELTEALRTKQLQRNGAESFLTYVKHMWPDFIEGRHHQIFAEKLEQVARGEVKRLIVNMPPRHTKSEFAIHLLSFVGFRQKSKTQSHADHTYSRTGLSLWSKSQGFN